MRIVMLSHGAIGSDARLHKEAVSLTHAGHRVEFIGIAPSHDEVRQSVTAMKCPVWLVPLKSVAAPPLGGEGVQLTSGRDGVKPRPAPRRWPLRPLAIGFLALMAAFVIAIPGDGIGSHNRVAQWVAALTALSLAAFLSAGGKIKAATALSAALSDEPNRAVREARLAAFRVASAAMSAPLGVTDEAMAELSALQRDVIWKYCRSAGALFDALAKIPRPDAVHIHDHIGLLAAQAIATQMNIPVVWDAHELYHEMAGKHPDVLTSNRWVIETAQGHVTKFITINDSIAENYRAHFPRLPPAAVVMNAIKLSDETPNAVAGGEARLHAAAGLPVTQKILLYQGLFSKHRGLELLICAGQTLDPRWTLVLMGWGQGDYEAKLRDLAKRHARSSVQPAVVFLPGVAQAELVTWTRGATLGVIPYENTGLNHLYCTPNKLWEYPGADVPFLCTDLIEMRKIVDQHHVGFVLPRDFSAQDIADAVNQLSDARIAQSRANCPAFIRVSNWDTYAPRLVETYRALGG